MNVHGASIVPTSYIRVWLLLIVGNCNVRRCCVRQCRTVVAKFHEIQTNDMKSERNGESGVE